MKFINLLRKELAELINKQMILSLVVMMGIFMIIGQIMETTINEAVSASYSVNICDRDNTEFTQDLVQMLKDTTSKVNVCDTEGDDYSAILKDNNIENLIIIPEGFTDSINSSEQSELISVSQMKSAAALSNITNDTSGGISLISECMEILLAEKAGISSDQLSLMNSPVTVSEQTVVADKSASVSLSDITSKLNTQNMMLPIVVFILIIMTSQTLMNAVTTEKIDKTLETLLSTPVSRGSVIGAKMLAAAIVALINAAVYMVGFSAFVTNATDSITEEMAGSVVNSTISADTALVQLGLSLQLSDYLLIGLQLFLTIMICLSVSLVLGAMADNAKSSQTLITPILMLAMVPYLISMLTDINSLPTVLKYVVYAIPFTHTFSAMPNLMFGNYGLFFGGLAYQAAFFAVCMFFALRLFKSDKIFTMSLSFLGKKHSKKKTPAEE